jgi:hypothetical protein
VVVAKIKMRRAFDGGRTSEVMAFGRVVGRGF